MSLKSGLIILSPISLASQTLNYIFTDDFSENSLLKWTEQGTQWQIITGSLSGSGTNITTTGLIADNFFASDFSGSFLFNLISGTYSGGGLGVQLRLSNTSQDSLSNCLFIICTHSGYVMLTSGSYDSSMAMASGSMGVNPTGSQHTGSFVISGSTASVSIDGSQIINYTGSFSGINAGGRVRLIMLSGSNGRFGTVTVDPYNSFTSDYVYIPSTAITPSGITGSFLKADIYLNGVAPTLYKCRGGFLQVDLYVNGKEVDYQNLPNTLENSTNAYFNIPLSAVTLNTENLILIKNKRDSPISVTQSVIELKYQH